MTTRFRTIVAPAPAAALKTASHAENKHATDKQWASAYNKHGKNARRNGIDGFLLGYDMVGDTPTGAFSQCNVDATKMPYLLTFCGDQKNITAEHLRFIFKQIANENYLRCGNTPTLFVRSIEDAETSRMFVATLRQVATGCGLGDISIFVENPGLNDAIGCGFDGALGNEVASVTTHMASDPENYRTQVAGAIVRSVEKGATQLQSAALVCSELATFDEPTFLAHNAAVFDAAEELSTQVTTNSILEAANV